MTYRKTAQSGSLPMSVETAKRKLQIETADLDDEAAGEIDTNVAEAIAAAAEYIEDQIKFALRPSTFILTLPGWPCFPLLLDRAPVREVVAIRYLDEDKVQQTLNSSIWYDVPTDTGAAIYLEPDSSLPPAAQRANAIEVEFDAGFDIPGETGATFGLAQPQRVTQAMALMTGHFFNNRDGVTDARTFALEMGVNDLLDTVRLFK